MDPVTIMMGAGALAGGVGGLLQGGKENRQGYERATKARKAGLPLFGLGGDEWSAIWHDIGAGTFDPNSGKYGDNPFIDIAKRGGMGGIRKEYQQQFIDNALKGYSGAENAIRGASTQAEQNVIRERTKGMADVDQSLQQAGMMSSNIAQQARANVGYQTSQAMTEIDNQLASMLSDLQLSKSQTMDAVLARNLGLETQTQDELMRFLVGNSGYGPYAGSMLYGQGGGYMPSGIDFESVGGGIAGLGNMLFGQGGLFAKNAPTNTAPYGYGPPVP